MIEIIDEHHLTVDGVMYQVDFGDVSEQIVYSLLADNRSYEAFVYPSEMGWQVLLLGTQYELIVEDEREKRLRASLGGGIAENVDFHLKAPMPGLVVAVLVSDGQEISKGDVLVILESMNVRRPAR